MMSKTAIFALAAAASLNVPAAFAASFPCDKAKSETEKVVCATPDLSTRDELVASIFKKAINTSGKEGLGALARRLLAARDACGSDTSCIAVNQIRALEIFALLGSTGGKPVGD